MMFYLLDEDGQPRLCSADQWAYWFETADRHIAKDNVDNVLVSTVFVGLDQHLGYKIDTLPLLWETMIFGGPHDDYRELYANHADAEAGHARALQMVKDSKCRN